MSKSNAQVAAILGKMQDRLNKTVQDTRLNAETIHVVSEELRIRTVKLAAAQQETSTRLQQDFEKAEAREGRQALRDQSNVQSLKNLAESVQKAFDQVKNDVSELLKLNQRLNERIDQVESRTAAALAALTPPSAAAQSIVNSKLRGIYDVTEDLDARLQKAEIEVEALRELRKAISLIANFGFGTSDVIKSK
jgi:predicted nuclease with TOPRIM domain